MLFDDSALAPLIAIVGSDGAGKSRLAADLRTALLPAHAVALCYLGLGTGELGNRIKRWPLIGVAFERRLSKNAKQTRSRDQRIPGLVTALVVFGFSWLRLRRFHRVLALRRQGVLVITDRYPQIDVPGFYDGPGLSAATTASRLIGWLRAREFAMYTGMAAYRPSLVIRLNIDAETAFSRKPDHALELIRAKVQVTPLLTFNGATITDLDAGAPYDAVRRAALAAIAPFVGETDMPHGPIRIAA